MKTLQDIKRELLASPATQAAYESQAAEFDMARELIAARSRAIRQAIEYLNDWKERG